MKLKFKLLNGIELEVEATPEEVLAVTGAATGVGAITGAIGSLSKIKTVVEGIVNKEA